MIRYAELSQPLASRQTSRAAARRVVVTHNTTHYLSLHYSELLSALKAQGMEVIVIAPGDRYVASLEGKGIHCVNLALSQHGMNPAREIRSIISMGRLLRREQPDVLINISIKPVIYGSLAARFLRIPTVCSMITGLGYVFLGHGAARRLLASAAASAYRLALSSNHRVFFQNPDDARFFVERRMVGESQAMVLAGTGIDTARFSPGPAGRRDGPVGYLMVGRLLSDKGVREYVEAARCLKKGGMQARCALLGPFDDNPAAIPPSEVEQWVRDGLIEYLGEKDDVAAVLQDYDVFVLPSYREGLPRAALEAMAMGKPIVTTDVPGCRETVEQGVNGYLVPAGDAGSLKSAMERFMTDRGLIQDMGRKSRAMAVDRFDVRDVNERIVNAIMEA